MHNHTFGLLAEYLVIIKYFFTGYLPLKHRWKSNAGEIDLILKRYRTIIFCEVKARRSNFTQAENYVTETQKRRLTRAAEHFLALNPRLHAKNVRFDLAIVRSCFNIKIFRGWIGW